MSGKRIAGLFALVFALIAADSVDAGSRDRGDRGGGRGGGRGRDDGGGGRGGGMSRGGGGGGRSISAPRASRMERSAARSAARERSVISPSERRSQISTSAAPRNFGAQRSGERQQSRMLQQQARTQQRATNMAQRQQAQALRQQQRASNFAERQQAQALRQQQRTATQAARQEQRLQAQTSRQQQRASNMAERQQAQALRQQQRAATQTARQEQRLQSQALRQQQRTSNMAERQQAQALRQQQRAINQAARQQQRATNLAARQDLRETRQQQRAANQAARFEQRAENMAARQDLRQLRQQQRAENIADRNERRALRQDRDGRFVSSDRGDFRRDRWRDEWRRGRGGYVDNYRRNAWRHRDRFDRWGWGRWHGHRWHHHDWWRPIGWGGLGAFLTFSFGDRYYDRYYWDEPVFYTYGERVVYAPADQIVVNEVVVGTAEEYAEQAIATAQRYETLVETTGVQAEESWRPLGIYAIADTAQNVNTTEPDRYVELVISKNGAIGGTYHDLVSGVDLPVQGSVDPKTQRAAWFVGNSKTVIETGLYNLTQPEAPALRIEPTGGAKQIALVRIQDPATAESATSTTYSDVEAVR